MQIPTIDRPVSLLGAGASQPTANAAQFGAGTGVAIQQLGEVAGGAIAAAARISQVKSSLEAERWVNDSMTQLRDYYSQWQADPQNHTSETYADEFKLLASKSLAEYESKAPSKLAREQFRSQFQGFVSSRYESALITTSRTKMDKMLESHADRNNSVVEGYRGDRLIPDVDANAELFSNISARFIDIDAQLGKLAPEQAKRMKNQLVEDATYAVMGNSPDLAKKILNMGTIEGRQRHAIENAIKSAEESTRAVDLSLLRQMGQSRLAQAELGKMPAKFELKDILPYLPDDKAQVWVNEHNAQIDVYNTATMHLNKVASWSGPAQADFLESLASSAGKNEDTAAKDLKVLQVISSKIADNVRQFQRDPGGYILEHNDRLKSLSDQINRLPEGSPERGQKYAERDALMIQLQGLPPDGVTGEEKNQYHVVNRAQVKVMSDAEAKGAVRRINESSPGEALNTIIGELSKHPGNESIAFNNLIQLQDGQGIRGDYWLVYKNWKNIAAKDLIGALQQAKSLRETAGDKLADYDKALDGYVNWKQWAATFPSDNFQMEGMVAGMRDGIISYALARAQTRNESPELAIKQSVDTWLYSEMGVGSINGQKVIFDKDPQDGSPKRTQSDITTLCSNLSLAPNYLDPRSIKLDDSWGREHFPKLRDVGSEDVKYEVLSHYIQTRGFFKPSADGKVATFYMRSDTGSPFEVRDKNNNAIGIDLRQVPELHSYISTFMNPRGIDVTPGPIDYSKPHITLVGYAPVDTSKIPNFDKFSDTQKFIARSSGAAIYQTNWPVQPKWMKPIPRK